MNATYRAATLELDSFKMSAWVFKQGREEQLRQKYEQQFVRQYNREWTRKAESALDAGLSAFRGLRTQAEARRVMKAVARELAGFGSDSSGFSDEATDVLYEALLKDFFRQFDLGVSKATGTPRGSSFLVNLTQKDVDALNAIKNITNQSAGSLFPESVMEKVAQVTEETVLNQGLSSAQAATKLEAELAGALGAESASVVPATFATNPQNYFEVLANNASLLSTNMGRMVAMDDAGVEVYEVVAVIDRRTSNICRSMDGRRISVSAGMEMVNDIVGFSGPQQLKSAFKWTPDRTVSVRNNRRSNDRLVKDGLGFPPYHGKCRSIVIPVI